MVLFTRTGRWSPIGLSLIGKLWKNCHRFNSSDVNLVSKTHLNAGARRLILEHQSQRNILHVQGVKAMSFLQGLITNDMNQLKPESDNHKDCMYSFFLNKSGRILYDTLVYRTDDPESFLIECDAGISDHLERHLLLYRIRQEVKVTRMDNDYQVWVAFDATATEEKPTDEVSTHLLSMLNTNDFIVSFDPRLCSLGLRILCPMETSFLDLSGILTQIYQKDQPTKPPIVLWPSSHEDNYRRHRYRFGIAEGAEEMPPGKCFPLEANGDFLHGVSFNKGCYLGQELTARVHHTGVVRKRHMPLELTAPCDPFNLTNVITTLEGNKVGTVLGSLEDRALALVRVAQAIQADSLLLDGQPCHLKKPHWWPDETLSLDKEKIPQPI